MSYEVKLNTRATRQVKKLDPHIKKVVKERLEETLSSDPHKYPLLSSRYSGIRRFAFSPPAGEFRAAYTIREDKGRFIIFIGPRENFYRGFQRYLR